MQRGTGYARQRLARLRAMDETLLQSSCAGSGDNFYHQNIRLAPHGLGIIGRCSCPVGINCKHCVAAILQVLEEGAPSQRPERPLSAAETPTVRRVLKDIQPRPLLALGSLAQSLYDLRSGRMVGSQQHRAGLAFDYAGISAHGKNARHNAVSKRQGELLEVQRQIATEEALRERLRQLGFKESLRQSLALPSDVYELFELPSDSAWQRFMNKGLAELRAEGWEVDIRSGFHFDLSSVERWYAEVDEVPGQHWFDLELGIVVEGQRISLLPILLRLIQQNPKLLSPKNLEKRRDDEQLRLQLDTLGASTGRPLQVALPFGRLKPLLATLGELYLRDRPEGRSLRLALPDAARLGQLDELQLEWQGGERLRRFAERLRDSRQTRHEAPAGLQADLRTYQLQGLAWLQSLRELGAGGVLGDDMGLGKTLQTLAHLLTEKNAGRLDRPALVVMPTSLIPNWQDEAARFAPNLRVLALHGPNRKKDFARLGEFDLLLTTYALLPRDLATWKAQPLHLVVLDEAQNIKTPTSKAAQAVRQLEARQRLCLSGTPLENHLGELWSLFHFLMPGWLGDAKQFARDYRTPIEKRGDNERLAHLNGRIRPFLLRRTKESVATELPAKTEIVQRVELSEGQRDLYETVRLAMDRKVRAEIQDKGMARSQMVILEALLKLRQTCCDLRLVEHERTRPLRGSTSGKLDSLMEMLVELFAEGRKVLLFSQFTSMLELIEAELQQRGIEYLILTGDTRDRRTPVKRFQAGEAPLFLISLKAGGTGLNLTAADTVIHYDPWWNPAAERQATDRAYRIGQDKPVFVYKLIARGTVEEKIQQLQQRKALLAEGILGQSEGADWQLREEDLDALFAPLPTA
ncbi:DEAD/DEAH box helicase [Pseudomonas tohonis]|uniref:DEAD/DEAH box helicase n=1 Tax=Pseudomonas tohonis TaxID=2725477 RepID=UPI00403AD868